MTQDGFQFTGSEIAANRPVDVFDKRSDRNRPRTGLGSNIAGNPLLLRLRRDDRHKAEQYDGSSCQTHEHDSPSDFPGRRGDTKRILKVQCRLLSERRSRRMTLPDRAVYPNRLAQPFVPNAAWP